MLKLKTNEEIGAYLKKLILKRYKNCRQFCLAYAALSNVPPDQRDGEVKRLANRMSQISKGKKGIQIYDFPIFSELLDASCEQILSAGELCFPRMNRKTNYSIASSNNESDWIEYLERKDCAASYLDEFGKSLIDYAIEFKNYALIKFLTEKGYITFVENDAEYPDLNFGATTSLQTRTEVKTLKDELFENKTLRTSIITLALEKNDCSVLEKMKAREFPPQSFMNGNTNLTTKIADYYDEQYLETILHSNANVIRYFCEEYKVKQYWQGDEVVWMFPFMGTLIAKAVKENHEYAVPLLDAAIKHNEDFFRKLKTAVLHTAQRIKKNERPGTEFKEVIMGVLHYYRVSKENDFVCFWYPGFEETSKAMTNVVIAKAQSENPEIQRKIDSLNDLYSQSINLEDYLFKKTTAR